MALCHRSLGHPESFRGCPRLEVTGAPLALNICLQEGDRRTHAARAIANIKPRNAPGRVSADNADDSLQRARTLERVRPASLGRLNRPLFSSFSFEALAETCCSGE